ncbi:hypothetical protein PG984_003704 [Apiospora sp. TS-2023a]
MDSATLATILVVLCFLGLPALAVAYHLARILVGGDNNNTFLSALVSLLLVVPVGALALLWIAYQLSLTLLFLPPALLISYFGRRDGPKDAVLAAAWWGTDLFYSVLHHGAARDDADASRIQTSNAAARPAPPRTPSVERAIESGIQTQVDPPPYRREGTCLDDPPPKYENIEAGREHS